MTEPTWQDQIFVTFGFAPFKWRLSAVYEAIWNQVHISVGPFWLSFGWPESWRTPESNTNG